MHLTHDQRRRLDRMAQTRKRREQAERASRDQALEALHAGVPQSRIAGALGISRMTIWRWVREINKSGSGALARHPTLDTSEVADAPGAA